MIIPFGVSGGLHDKITVLSAFLAIVTVSDCGALGAVRQKRHHGTILYIQMTN